MKKEDFDEWLENPITEEVFQYWRDSAIGEAEHLRDQLIDGVLLTYIEQAKIATVHATLERITEIDFEDVDTFYNGDREK